MKYVIAALALFLAAACSTDPYKVCHDADDAYETPASVNRCIEQVQQNEQRKAQFYFQNRQAFQLPVQQQQVQSFPMMTAPVQTNCSTMGGYTTCTSY